MKKKKQGFASLSKERRKEIASQGGKAAHALGRAHEFTPEEARAAGQKGARIGKKGGKKGGAARRDQEG